MASAKEIELKVLTAINCFREKKDCFSEEQLSSVLDVIASCENYVRALLAERVLTANKRVVVLVGANQAGKSTATLFLSDETSLLLTGRNRKLVPRHDHEDFKLIGTGFVSRTVLPNVRVGDDMVFVDLPGALDTRGLLARLVNMVMAKQIFALPNVVVVHVIQYNSSTGHAVSLDLYGLAEYENTVILLTRCEDDDPESDPDFVTNGFDVSVMPYPSKPAVDTRYCDFDGVKGWRSAFLQRLRDKTPGPAVYAPREIDGEENLIRALKNTTTALASDLIRGIVDAVIRPAEGYPRLTLEQAAQLLQLLASAIAPASFEATLTSLEAIGFTQPGNEANARVLHASKAIERLGGASSSAWLVAHSKDLHIACHDLIHEAARKLVRGIVDSVLKPPGGSISITLEQATQVLQLLEDARAPLSFEATLASLEAIGFTQPGNDANARVLRAVGALKTSLSEWLVPHSKDLHTACHDLIHEAARKLVHDVFDVALKPADGPTSLTLEQLSQLQQWLFESNSPTSFKAALISLEMIGFTQPGNEANARVLLAVDALKTPSSKWFVPHYEVILIACHKAIMVAAEQRISDIVNSVVKPGCDPTSITLEQATQLWQCMDAETSTSFEEALTLLKDIGFTTRGANEANNRVLCDVRAMEHHGCDFSFAWIKPHHNRLAKAFPRAAMELKLKVECIEVKDFEANVHVVSGRSLVLSEALRQLEDVASDLETLVLIGFDSLVVDKSVTCWNNLVLFGEQITVTPGVKFDLSAHEMPIGLRNKTQAKKSKDGVVGEPGKPGGSLLVLCSALDGVIGFRSKGQKGGNGQHGGDGISGENKQHSEEKIAELTRNLGDQAFAGRNSCSQNCGNANSPRALSGDFHSSPTWPTNDHVFCTVTTRDHVSERAIPPGRGGRGGNGGHSGQGNKIERGNMAKISNTRGFRECGSIGNAGAASRDGWWARLRWQLKYDKDSIVESSEYDVMACQHYLWFPTCNFQDETDVTNGKRYTAGDGHSREPDAAPEIKALTQSQAIEVYKQVIEHIETAYPLVRLSRQRIAITSL